MSKRFLCSLLATCLVALLSSAYAAVPARFVEYVRFTGANDGTTATYVQPVSTLAFTARNITAYIDFRPSETQPTAAWSDAIPRNLCAAYLMGTTSDTVNKQSAVGLKNSGGQWYLAYFSGTSSGVTIPVVLGNRYRVGTAPNSTIGSGYMQMRAEGIDDGLFAYVRSEVSANSGSAGDIPFLAFNAPYRYSGYSNGIGKYSANIDLYSLRVWYDSATITYDLYPCVDSNGDAGLYNRVNGAILYPYTRTVSGGWKATGGTTNKSLLTAPEGVSDSSVARVNDGVVEFAVRGVAKRGTQVSADGETWGSSAVVWTAAGGNDVTMYCRPDPGIGYIRFRGWKPESDSSGDSIDGAAVSADGTTLTVPAGRPFSYVATADFDGLPDELILDGDFEAATTTWRGRLGKCDNTDTAYVNSSVSSDVVGAKVWNYSAKDLRAYQYVRLLPGTYTFKFDTALPSSVTAKYSVNMVAEVYSGATGRLLCATNLTGKAQVSPVTRSYDFTVPSAGQYRMSILTAQDVYSTSKTWIDNVSLRLKEPFAGIVVEGSPGNYKTQETTPYYGNYPMADGESITFVAPSGTVAVEGGTVNASVSGYRVDTWDSGGGEWVEGAVQTGTSYTHVQSGAAKSRLVWLWSSGMTVDVQSTAQGASVSADGETWQDSLSVNANGGDELTFFAGPDPYRYYFWSGCPEGAVFSQNNTSVTFTVSAAHTPCVHDVAPAGANVWTGAAQDGAFETAGNWSFGVAPGPRDNVVIPKGASVTVNAALDITSLSVAEYGDGESTTLTFKNGTGANIVSNDVAVGAGGVLTHSANTGSTATYKLYLKVGGNVRILEGGAIDVTRTGFYTSTGPGASAQTVIDGDTIMSWYIGATFASQGYITTRPDNAPPKTCHGSVLHPYSIGSGGSGSVYAGGAVRIEAGGTVAIDGEIRADGPAPSEDKTSGTGGSIWIEAAKIQGSGLVSAEARKVSSCGRIALYQTATFGWADWQGTVSVVYDSGVTHSPGTYYRQDASGAGELILNTGTPANSAFCATQLPLADDGDPKSAYSHVAVKLGARRRLSLLGPMKIRDLDITSSTYSYINLNGHKLRVVSREHKGGKGWAGGNYAQRIASGLIIPGGTAEEPGEIVWSTGFTISVR